ncbi:MAG: hypothetical protein PUD55_06270 [Firmicutes bacterium]|nr:hypothetical protein [Bacillota bacterium]
MITINVESALTSVLLVVGIVAVIFLTVLLSRLIGTVDRVNKIVDESALTVYDVKKQVTGAIDSAKTKKDKVSTAATAGIAAAKAVIDKLPIKR